MGGSKVIVQNHAGIPGVQGLPKLGKQYDDDSSQRLFPCLMRFEDPPKRP